MKDRDSIRVSELASRLRLLTGLVIALACLLLWLGGAVFGYAKAGGAARPLTTPPSSHEDGLVTRPDPVDDGGNLAITGNVAGGKHFRGEVPYRSTTSIDAPLGSTELDSFLRITEPVDLADTSRVYQPYHSPTGAATTLQPGSDGRSIPVTGTAGTGVRTYNSMNAGASTSPQSSSAAVSGMDQYQQQLQELQRRLGAIEAGVDELDRDAAAPNTGPGNNPLNDPRPSAGNVPPRRESLLQETARLLSATLGAENAELGDAWQTDTPSYRGTGLRLYDPQRDANVTLDSVLAAPRTQAVPANVPRPSVPVQERALAGQTNGLPLPRAIEAPLPSAASAATVPVPLPSRAQPAPAETPRAALSPRDCETSLLQGQFYLTQGQYLRAAESFASASAYGPIAPQAYLGRCQALLGAGQFAASAMLLTGVLESDPGIALQKADLVTICGGPDAFISLYNDLAQRATTGSAPDLQLLLAYIYYQMDQRDLARVAVHAAEKALPTSRAVAALKAAINE